MGCVQFCGMRIRRNQKRGDRLARLQEASGEKTKAGASDIAVKHYLADLQAKKNVFPKVSDGLARELSNPWLPIERERGIGVRD